MLSLSKLVKKFGEYKEVPSHKDEVRFCCPYCVLIGKPPDRKFHLYVNLTKGVGYCFRCGKVLKFSKDFFVKESFYAKALIRNNANGAYLYEIPKSVSVYETEGYRFLLFKLGNNYTEDYINRFIDLFEVRLCIDERFPHLFKRLMFPVKFNGEIVGFQFRSIYGEEPKYYTYGYRGCNVKNYVFNYDLAIKSEEVYICEGVFDVLPFMEKGVAIFGKHLTNNQIRLLLNSSWKRYYICLDGDAIVDAFKLGFELYKNGIDEVYVVDLSDTDEDPCEIGHKIFEYKVIKVEDKLF